MTTIISLTNSYRATDAIQEIFSKSDLDKYVNKNIRFSWVDTSNVVIAVYSRINDAISLKPFISTQTGDDFKQKLEKLIPNLNKEVIPQIKEEIGDLESCEFLVDFDKAKLLYNITTNKIINIQFFGLPVIGESTYILARVDGKELIRIYTKGSMPVIIYVNQVSENVLLDTGAHTKSGERVAANVLRKLVGLPEITSHNFDYVNLSGTYEDILPKELKRKLEKFAEKRKEKLSKRKEEKQEEKGELQTIEYMSKESGALIRVVNTSSIDFHSVMNMRSFPVTKKKLVVEVGLNLSGISSMYLLEGFLYVRCKQQMTEKVMEDYFINLPESHIVFEYEDAGDVFEEDLNREMFKLFSGY